MSREVRSIFLTLIGTIAGIVVLSLVTEMINISLMSIQLQQNVRMAANKSLVMFSQESYKERDSGSAGTVGMPDIYSADGNWYVSGDFYGTGGVGASEGEIYNSIYVDGASGDAFKAWLNGVDANGNSIKSNWYNIRLLASYHNNEFDVLDLPNYEDYSGDIEAYNAAVSEYSRYTAAESFVKNYVSPLNFGVPYIDEATVNRIYQWTLTQILSNCNSNSIVKDEAGNYCVEKSGFRIYTDQAKIKDIEYTVYKKVVDINNYDSYYGSYEVTSTGEEFERLTGINPGKLGFSDDITYITTDENSEAGQDERSNICVVTVTYSVPVSYVGISPIKRIFESVWNSQVEGLDGSTDLTDQYYSLGTKNLTGGGLDSNAAEGVLPVSNTIVFYVVR